MIEGIILRTDKYQENSKIAYVYTNTGLLSLIIKASCLYKSKNYAYSQELSKIQFDYVYKPKTFSIMKSGILLNNYIHIKNDYERLKRVMNILLMSFRGNEHVLDQLNMYNLLSFSLEGINNSNYYNSNYYLCYYYTFFLKLLYLLGVGPNFKKENNSQVFSIYDGCYVNNSTEVYFSEKVIQIIKTLYLTKMENFVEFEIEDYQSIDKFINCYYSHYFNINLK